MPVNPAKNHLRDKQREISYTTGMNVALFGGTFDPPHLGHLFVADTLLLRQLADQVWFVPVKQHPFGKPASADQHRVAMLELMIKSFEATVKADTSMMLGPHGSLSSAQRLSPQLRIDTFELEQAGPSYSYNTLKGLSQRYPEHTFSWVIGSDNLSSFHKWGSYQQLLKEFVVYVYPRQGSPMEPVYSGMIPLENVKEVEISSSEIRKLVKEKKDLAGLVVEGVETYISDHQLYVTHAS